ncbi:galectin-4-like isoform X2 [Tachysurus fulvidraco]|uniref:galectin-4-like isoform X2 n=1 Tax=Tachysurus fulvidraco TaxID=1234273 RepID=UPI001FEDF1DA|nr:galectin-4-like isoform X2 [Tachysurus fulvidraco]
MAFVAPPGYQPLYNPTIPYVGPISGGLRAGMSIYIQGKIQHHINRFHVNLQCGEFDGCDIAFHFNPRFDLWDKVIFNTFQNGAWEGEEKVKKMPFRKGEHFELVIVVNSEGYQVKVNGKEFHLFQHRMPLDRVCAIEIGGDVSIDTINLIGGMQGMGGGNMGYPGGNLPVMGLQPIFNPVIPYSDMIPGGMVSKRTIIIRGMVPYQADRFWINFLVGGSRNIAFHINPRIREGLVVRNCQIDGSWGDEETDLNFNPFQEGQYFEISIRCSEEKFKVYANGQHMCNFHHRLRPYNQINMLEVGGDVQLSYIHY